MLERFRLHSQTIIAMAQKLPGLHMGGVQLGGILKIGDGVLIFLF